MAQGNDGFKEGDVVRLMSGGAKMTVESINGDYAECVWSDGKRVYRDAFKVTLLMIPPADFDEYMGIC